MTDDFDLERFVAAQRGAYDGALAELGCDLAVERLDVFVEPDLCVAHLA